MFIKMRESKGFTLVELMIVVAIIGILAAVAVPYYQRYIQKSRLTSMVWPGVHAIETNLAAYYSLNQTFPTAAATLVSVFSDANTKYFTPTMSAASTLNIALVGGAGPLQALGTQALVAHPVTASGKIAYWQYTGALATNMGLAGPQ
ncbi:MAG: prepilin-type N-terminal cleavage/methylation domain-containing protein [Syntrophobacteraceae bacterium]